MNEEFCYIVLKHFLNIPFNTHQPNVAVDGGKRNVVANVLAINLQFQGLSEFQRMQPPSFCVEYNPTIAENWQMKIEKIFKVLTCTGN